MDQEDLYQKFIEAHQPQLESSGVPKIFWETLFKKLQNKIFDSGLVFQMVKIDYGDTLKYWRDPVWKLIVSSEKGLLAQDENNIYLVDHAWSYDKSCARRNLENIPGLLDRMCTLMGHGMSMGENDKVQFVLQEMWRYNQYFTLNTGPIENTMPIWYIMDELGAAINHSNDPNFRAVPFLYLTENITYSLLFPVKDCNFNDEVTRDFVEGQTNDERKKEASLIPWVGSSFSNESFEQVEPDASYFLAGRLQESLPELSDLKKFRRVGNRKLKVFSEYKYINDYLNHPAFELVDVEDGADILWYTSHFKDFRPLSINSPNVFVNQFPFENVLTIKDLLSVVCRRIATKSYDPDTFETYPEWLPTTYNLCTELVQFVAYFNQRSLAQIENHWICKPWNLARGLDTHITNDLCQIIRLSGTGAKVAQKYITNPVLFKRDEIGKVKFDIRYVVMLKSVKPLRAYAYKNFFLRFANKEFALNNFDDYEQHFTVMNYSEDSALFHLKSADFILEWDRQYPQYSWKKYIEPEILKIFRRIFEAAVAEKPPKGIAESPQSRAVYAVDLMLEWKKQEVQPMLLEINFAPDCKRACEYYPNFYNDIFKCLFLDDFNPEVFHNLSSKDY